MRASEIALWLRVPCREDSPLESDVPHEPTRNTLRKRLEAEVAVMDFSSFFWLLVWAFVLGCYLVVLFQIVVDLFRDENLSGWWKALWIVFLIIVPFLSALIYVIARGRGMAERHAAAKGPREEPYVPPPIIHMSSPTDQIASAQTLLDQGAITQAEFDQLKQRALAGSS
jgi:Short C-terminal domain